ncbi:Uncharacterised protein [Vibrio cholerae]|uniref:Uncharacterized protein n=1 Tax=Vibrio cholerae TaxID=666 RepID=A0A655WVS4_VIBCL|nr:Uncharacterised protein [Vibrio cholerae]
MFGRELSVVWNSVTTRGLASNSLIDSCSWLIQRPPIEFCKNCLAHELKAVGCVPPILPAQLPDDMIDQ